MKHGKRPLHTDFDKQRAMILLDEAEKRCREAHEYCKTLRLEIAKIPSPKEVSDKT